MLESPLDHSEQPLVHLTWLWEQVGPHADYFRSLLAQRASLSVTCFYTSDCDHCRFDLNPGATRLADALGVSPGVSTIFVGRG